MRSDNLIKQFDPGALKGFEQDRVWLAFKALIEDRVELVRDELESGFANVGGDEEKPNLVVLNFEALKKRQGECDGLRFILRLPTIIKELWDQEEQIAKSKKEE